MPQLKVRIPERGVSLKSGKSGGGHHHVLELISKPLTLKPNALIKAKKPLTRVSKRVPGAHGKRGLERGWQKRLAKDWRKVGEGLAKVGTGLAKDQRRVSGFPCSLQFRNSRGAFRDTGF